MSIKASMIICNSQSQLMYKNETHLKYNNDAVKNKKRRRVSRGHVRPAAVLLPRGDPPAIRLSPLPRRGQRERPSVRPRDRQCLHPRAVDDEPEAAPADRHQCHPAQRRPEEVSRARRSAESPRRLHYAPRQRQEQGRLQYGSAGELRI